MERRVLLDIILIIVIILGIWNFFAQFFIDNYKSDPIITGAFMGIAGVLTTGKNYLTRFLTKKKDEEGE